MILATFIDAADQARLGWVDPKQAILIDLQQAHSALMGEGHPALYGMLELIESGASGLERVREIAAVARQGQAYVLPLDSVRFAAPLLCPPQMRDFSVFETHMRQAAVGMARLRQRRTGSPQSLPQPSDIVLPDAFYRQPLYYKTNRFSVIGPEQDVMWPSYTHLLDYELEFGIVISRRGRNIPRERAAEYIFGYTIFNDFSARDAQEFEMTGPLGPTKGKDFDTGNALGPWIVTADELPDPYALRMTARVNGEIWSEGNSRDMVHRFEDMIAHVSKDETLYPGEFFGSGTVGGGCGLELDRWLQPGDVVELEVEGIGILRNRVVGTPGPDGAAGRSAMRENAEATSGG